MKYDIHLQGELSVLPLFLWDRCEHQPFDERFIRRLLLDRLREMVPGSIDLWTPSDVDLDRFVVIYEDKKYTARCYTPKDLQSMLPAPVYAALVALDKEEWIVGPKKT